MKADKIILIIAALLMLLFLYAFLHASLINSFNAGELTPLLKYRVDLDKQHMGVETMENMLVKQQGATVRRPGTEYINDANDINRLVPFEYATTDTYVLRFTDQRVYFYRNGGTIQQ